MSDYKQKNALALEELTGPVVYYVDNIEVKLTPSIVKEYITKGVNITNSEYKMFVEICKARNLNPFLGEVHLIKYSETQPAQIVVGRDAFVKRAVVNPLFNGREQGVVVLKNDEIVYRKGSMVLSDETLVGGWAKVYRKGWDYPVETSVSLKEAIQTTRDGKPNSNWATRPGTMVEKVALVRALRDAFVEDLGGMYDKDEVWENETLKNVETQEDPTAKQDDVIEIKSLKDL